MTPKEILQIDATILAGLLILLTIITVEFEDPLTDLNTQLEITAKKLEDALIPIVVDIGKKELELVELKDDRQVVLQQYNELKSDLEIRTLMEENSLKIIQVKFEIAQSGQSPERSDKLKKFNRVHDNLFIQLAKGEDKRRQPFLDEISFLTDKISTLRKVTDQLKQTSTLLNQNYLIEVQILKDDIDLELEKRKSRGQIFFLQKTESWIFGGSFFAASALIAVGSMVFSETKPKVYKIFLGFSLGIMGIGFLYLILVFLTISGIINFS